MRVYLRWASNPDADILMDVYSTEELAKADCIDGEYIQVWTVRDREDYDE